MEQYLSLLPHVQQHLRRSPLVPAALALLTGGTLLYTVLRSPIGSLLPTTIESPRTELPRLTPKEREKLPYPPDVFPGARWVTTPYGTIRVYEWGPEDGRKVVFVHGIGSPCVVARDLLWELVEKGGCRVLVFDLYGRGYSDTPLGVPHDYRLYAAELIFALHSSPQTQRWHNFTLIGYSFGGGISAAFAKLYPHLVRDLVLLAPKKLIQTSDLNFDTKPKFQTALPDGTLVIKWDTGPGVDGQHTSTYSFDFLRTHANLRWRLRNNFNDRRQVLWDKRLMEQDVLWIDYQDYMESDEMLLEAVRQLSIYGLVFLRKVPENSRQNSVEGIAKRIGNIKETFYGRTWDVKSVKDAKNIAYTSLNLGLHMDLLYFESPPGLQFLHCIRNSVTGGSSLFADAFRAAQTVRMTSEPLFKALCDFPVTFHYRNDGHHYHYTRPTVVLEKNTYLRQPRIDHMNWSPPFQAPIEADTNGKDNRAFRSWLHAIRNLGMSIEDPESQFELKLKEGECVIFNNRRVVHGRREFDPKSGDRWLKGTYVDVDVFLSKFRTLSERFKGGLDNHDL